MSISALMIKSLEVIFNTFGSDVVVTPFTVATTDGGYSGQTETDGTPTVFTKAVPFNEFKNLSKLEFGNLETGEFQLALKYDETFDLTGATRYKITYNSDTYNIIKFDRYAPESTVVAYIITVKKRLS